MREPHGLATRSTVLAVLLHAVLLGLILVGWRWHRPDDAADRAPGALDARMVAFGDLSASTQRALRGPEQAATAPEPLPEPIADEPVPTPPAPQPVTPTPVPAPRETVKPVVPPKPEPAPVAKAEPAAKPQPMTPAAKPTPAPEPAKPAPTSSPRAKPDLAAEAAAEAARLSRSANLAKQRAAQLTDARSPNPGMAATPQGSRSGTSSSGGGQGPGKTNSGQQKWLDAVARAIEAKWIRPDDISPGATCPIHIRIIPGGEVISASVGNDCPYAEEARRSVEKAVRDASPLPFKGYEDVYARDFTANFKPSR